MKCPNCKVVHETNFCPDCGAELGGQLRTLLRFCQGHVKVSQRNHDRLTEFMKKERPLATNLVRRYGNRLKSIDSTLAKWTGWADALEEVLAEMEGKQTQ